MFNLNDLNNKNYVLISKEFIEEYQIQVYELIHNKTKAKIILFDCDDENKVFNICFKTAVSDDTGVPHILEHSVLCGSRKYNVKDPFIELAKSSLNTFLNAMTFPDKTCYPVASTNFKDFCNLIDVYLDAVFFPNIYKNKFIFEQEGYHLEIEDEKSDIKYNGVVLNEMKGYFSDPHYVLGYATMKSLYNGTIYGFETGGLPKSIVKLTYEDFLNFHKRFYSPTNSVIYLYGKMDFNERLEYIDREYLSKFVFEEKNVISYKNYTDLIIKNPAKLETSDIKINTKFNIKNVVLDYYNVDKINKDSNYASINFLLSEDKNQLENIVIQILNYILFDQVGSIISDKLMKNNLGQSTYTIYENSFEKEYFTLATEMISEDKIETFVNTVYEEIENLIKNGIDREKLEAGINSIYYSYLENDTSNYPKGLYLSLNLLDTYLYDKGITTYLKYKKEFEQIFNEDLEDKNNIFIKTLKKLFIDNQFVTISILKPKINLMQDYENITKQELDDYKKELSNKNELQKLIDDNKKLKEYQMLEEDKSCLPTLDIKDIDRDKKYFDYKTKNVLRKTVINTNLDIDELCYFGISYEIKNFDEKKIILLSLMMRVLTKISTKNYDYNKLNNNIDKYSGLFDVKILCTEDFNSFDTKLFIKFNIKTTVKNISKMFEILTEIINNTKFDDIDRIKTLLLESKSVSNRMILNKGHIVSFNRARSKMNLAFRVTDLVDITGIGFNILINDLMKDFDKNKNDLIVDIKELYKNIFYIDNAIFDVCIKDDNYKIFEDSLTQFIDSETKLKSNLNQEPSYNYKYINIDNVLRKSNSEAFITNADVNFVSRAGKFDSTLYSGSHSVLRIMLSLDFLWTNIRVVGGAYGCAALFMKNGLGGFTTFRDPNLIKSDEVFKNVYDYIKNLNIDEETIKNYIISTIGTVDMPLSNSLIHEKNVEAYITNVTNELYNIIRHEILETDLSKLKSLSESIREVIDCNETCALVSSKMADEAKLYYKEVRKLNDE